MDQPAAAPAFGALLRRWRHRRGRSQLALAADAEVSARHLSWLETGRAQPSRAMALRLARCLDLPLRDRNALLVAAGYAPMYAERALTDAALRPAREALQRLLDAHEPAPALAVDRHWQLVAANRMVEPLLAAVAPALRAPPVNVLRLSLHPDGLAPLIADLPAWRRHVMQRLGQQLASSGDPQLAALRTELRALAVAAGGDQHDDDGAASADPIVPLVLNTPWGRLAFVTTVTVFGAAHELTLAELAVETLLPADTATADALQRIRAGLG